MEKSSFGNLAFQWLGDTLILRIRVQARSKSDAIEGIHGDHLRVKLTTPPVDGKANQSLTKLLGKAFGVPPSQVIIEKGDTQPFKRVRISAPKNLPDFLKNCL